MIILRSLIAAIMFIVIISMWSEINALFNRRKYKKISFDEFMIWCEKCNKSNRVSGWEYADREINYGVFDLYSSFVKYDYVYFRFSLKDTFRYKRWRKKVLNEKRIKREEKAMMDIQIRLRDMPEEIKTTYYSSKKEAEEVIAELYDYLNKYGNLRITDFYIICRVGYYNDKASLEYGWNYEDLIDNGEPLIVCRQLDEVSDTWTIDMPEPVPLYYKKGGS